jgi:pimeloyl-ACP methyl ester carboxylesterase
LGNKIPNSDLKVIEGCSHNVHLEKPDEFNAVVDEFLIKN